MTKLNQEQSYYDRMSNAKNDKLRILDYIEPGMHVLDYGAGTADIAQPIIQAGAKYTALDSDPAIQTLLKSKNIDVIDTEDILINNTKYDIIYLSSVVHEMYSQHLYTDHSIMPRFKVDQYIFQHLMSRLKPNGLLIIRDWAGYADDDTHDSEKYILKIEPSIAEDFYYFYQKLKKEQHKMNYFTHIISLDEKYDSRGEITRYPSIYKGPIDAIYEAMYHHNWGPQSFERESKEIYGHLNVKTIYQLANFFTKDVVSVETYFDEDYRQYLSKKYRIFYGNGQPFDYPHTKLFAVLKNKKGNANLSMLDYVRNKEKNKETRIVTHDN